MKLSKFTPEEKKLASKAKFKKKAPKKPKTTASTSVWENYYIKHNSYVKDLKEAAKAQKKKEALIKAAR